MPPLTQTARTRSVLSSRYLLHTPESFVRTPVPGLTGGAAIVHAAPALGAQFCWITVELEPGGVLQPAVTTRFLYILSGEGVFSDRTPAIPGTYAFAAASHPLSLTATSAMTAVVLDKAYEPLDGVPQADPSFIRQEQQAAPQPLAGDPALRLSEIQVRTLIPTHPQFDFAVNIMQYAPGAALPQVEIHYMEHGLLMLEGEGLYLLGNTWYPVQAGDFIWMAPFCPQQFMAASTGAKYLIYKNFNRMPKL